ncbi:MAG: hypothetical protein A3F46_06335 [Legionellales bacterium RIFCSPHIGHO2_12_FULL_42_9]|nr:MAG: hypothetical protein A3F46_06335 [Legionellales bacterium RIFCSPHIGHO2_12_FULL_42_9]
MTDMKSMLPDLKDVTSIANKLFKDVKKSVSEIVSDYKEKHACQDDSCKTGAKTTKTEAKDDKADK